MSGEEKKLRNEIVMLCHRMYGRGLISGAEGNVSARLGPDGILVTPSGINKGFITVDDLVVTDMNGRLVSGDRPASSETLMHLKAYELRPDVQAVVHAHPPCAVALTLAGYGLAEPLLPEVVLLLGRIPTARYAMPSSPEGAEVIQELIEDHNALLLDRHGSLTVGADLTMAYNLLELVEHAAKIVLAARQAGPVTVLAEPEIAKLVRLGLDKGFLKKKPVF